MESKLIGLVVTNLAGSGAEKVVLNLFNMFEKFGHNVYIFLLEDLILYKLTEKERSKIISLTKNRKYHKLFSFLGDRILHNNLEKRLKEIEKSENKEFDLILSNLPSADRVLHYSKRDNIFSCIHTSYYQEVLEFERNNKNSRATKKKNLYKKIYENRNLITVANQIKDDLKKFNINEKKILTIYNPFDFNNIRHFGNEILDDIPSGDYLISASAFRPVKRHDILLDAYKKSGIKLKLILLCSNTKKLVDMIKERGLEHSVEILGFRTNPYPYIKNAKALILSSEREGLPTVLIESLILGTAVVSTNCISGPSEILTGALSKYLTRVNDSEDLALKMNQILVDEVIIKDDYIQKFNEINIVNQYLELISIN